MKITAVEGFRVAFRPDPALGNAATFIRRREHFLVRLTAEDGNHGWGEVSNVPAGASAILRSRLAPMVLGQDPRDYLRLYWQMCGALAYDRRGASRMALSALDMALVDLAARMRGEAVARMLGGPSRSSVTAYASGPFIAEGDPYGHYRAGCEALAKRGFRAIKPRAGLDPSTDAGMVKSLRSDLGRDMMLMVDLNQGSSVPAALSFGRKAADADLLWIEEPLQPEDMPGYAALSGRMHAAVAGGEALGSLAAFRDALAVRAFDVLQPDLTVCGGFTGFAQVAALGAAHDLPVMPHVFGGIVGSRAALQMAALLPQRPSGGARAYPFFEVDVTDNPILALDGGVAPDGDGRIAIPDDPGIGVTLAPEDLAPWLEESWRVTGD